MPTIRDDQLEALRDAIVAAYPSLDDLRELARLGLGKDLDTEINTARRNPDRCLGTDTLFRQERLARCPLRRRHQAAAGQQRAERVRCRGSAARRCARPSRRCRSRASTSRISSAAVATCSTGQLTRGLRVLLLLGVGTAGVRLSHRTRAPAGGTAARSSCRRTQKWRWTRASAMLKGRSSASCALPTPWCVGTCSSRCKPPRRTGRRLPDLSAPCGSACRSSSHTTW